MDWAHCIQELVDQHYPHVEKIRLVMDNLNTHTKASLYEAFKLTEGEKNKPINESTIIPPKHGSWLNMAEIELSHLSRQCLWGPYRGQGYTHQKGPGMEHPTERGEHLPQGSLAVYNEQRTCETEKTLSDSFNVTKHWAGTGESHLWERMRQPKAARPEDGQKSGTAASEYALVGGGSCASRAGMWCHQLCEDALDEPMQRRPVTPQCRCNPRSPQDRNRRRWNA